MEIVPITETYLNDCVKIFIDAYNSPPWNCQWTTEKAESYLSELFHNSNFVGFMVYENQYAAGAILGHRKTWWTNDQLMIDELFVSPTAQKKGYGHKLMQQCEEHANQNGIGLLVLMTNKYLPVFNFYEKLNLLAADQYVFMFKQL